MSRRLRGSILGVRLAASVLALAIAAACPAPARADPPIVATLDMGRSGATLKGELRFDLGGGPVRGQAELDLPANPQSLPKNRAGAGVNGRYRVRVEIDGDYRGGLFGTMAGTARISGTFVNAAGCSAAVSGAGTFSGSVTGPSGGVEITGDWERVEYNGCDLASPQPFSVNLPFGFPPVHAPPVMNGQSSGGQPTGAQPASGTSGWALPGGYAAVAAALACCAGVLFAAGLLLLVLVRRRSAGRRRPSLPEHLPELVSPRRRTGGTRLPPHLPR